MPIKIHIPTFLLGLMLLFGPYKTLYAQQEYYKFPITQEGVYKITLSQAEALGASSLEEINIYGQGGLLPQKLEAEDLQMKVIPAFQEEHSLYVYLAGPHQTRMGEDTLTYTHHLYADTLFYLIGTGQPTASRIDIMEAGNHSDHPSQWLYQTTAHKAATHNLLSSGRNWYGHRVFSGESTRFSFDLSPWEAGPLYYQANFMGQSLQESNLEVQLGNQMLEQFTIPSIPPTTYGLKGREKAIQGHLPYSSHVGNSTEIQFSIESGDPNATAYLDYFLIGIPHASMDLPQGIFHHLGQNPSYPIATADTYHIWDLTDFHQPKRLLLSPSQNTVMGVNKLAVFDPQNVPEINELTAANLSLREDTNATEFVIITAPSLLPQARRLADHKQQTGIPTTVVTTSEVYDAYGYGTRDITAIRNFLADQYHEIGILAQVLLFGKGTFDYKQINAGNPSLVPTYSSRNSLNPLTTYSSDDYFGFLQYGEGEWEESEPGDLMLSIGVGRIPAINLEEAKNAVDKIIRYETRPLQLGKWKRKLLFMADDGDQNIHLRHAESHAEYITTNHPEFEIQKLYLDNYEQINSGSSQSAPVAKESLSKTMQEGVFLVNFIGHGNENTLTAERIFQNRDIEDWPESNHTPLFVTATCEFGRHDSPGIRSGAEALLFAARKGAIALLTTGRPVFSSINFSLNEAFIRAVFRQDEGQYQQLGDIYKHTKNNSLNGPFNRNFALLGDPSLRLALPELSAAISQPLDIRIDTETDTIKAHQHLKITGQIRDPLTDAHVSSFQGEYEIELLDKPSIAKTLGDESPVTDYQQENRVLHRGKGKVENGTFEAEFYVPQNMDYRFGQGTVRLFATAAGPSMEAMKASRFIIGGSVEKEDDREGPVIRMFAEDSLNRVNKVSSTRIKLIAKLSDPSGIQIAPFNLGQNITLTVNGENPQVLNDQYHAMDGSFTHGIIVTEVEGLQEGKNVLSLTAFDNQGNPSTAHLEIEVHGSRNIRILEHLSYPNPTSALSQFKIRHNRPGENLILRVNIFSLLGQEIISVEKRFPKASSVLTGIVPIFLRDKATYLVKGTYIYRLDLKSEEDYTSDQASGKLHIQ